MSAKAPRTPPCSQSAIVSEKAVSAACLDVSGEGAALAGALQCPIARRVRCLMPAV